VAWKTGLRWHVVVAAGAALALTAAALIIAIIAATAVQSNGQVMGNQLVPAAASANDLLSRYQTEQAWLRGYVTSGAAGSEAPFTAVNRQMTADADNIRDLVRGYPAITAQLDRAVAAHQAWLTNVADPQFAAMGRGDVAAARAIEADIPVIRSYVVNIVSATTGLQASITRAQQVTLDQFTEAQDLLVGSLIGMCVVVLIIVGAGVTMAWLGLLRPFKALRAATDTIAGGDYRVRIPIVGPNELRALGRSTELMRMRLVATLAERERAEFWFRRLFDAAPDAMIAIGWDGSVTMANTQAVRLFGYPAGEFIGRAVETLVPEESRAALQEERTRFFADPESQTLQSGLKMSGRRRDGSTFPAEIALSALPTENGMAVAAAIRDVSGRLALEKERERLRAEAERERTDRRARQTQRLESLGQLVGGVAHDFNNLLNVIHGYADFTAEEIQPLAADDPRLTQVLYDIEQVQAAAQQAARLTRQLLTFARHEVTRPEVLDLNEAVQDAVELLRRTLGEHIELGINPDPELWPVKADRGQLEQVLLNLAVNARDAMPGGGRLTIDTGNVEVDETYASGRPGLNPGRYIRLRVSDSGVGMDRATLDRLFEPFFTTKPKGRGTGLGLATVYGIVTGAGGTIDVYSEPGLGTAFSVLLPATFDAGGAARAPADHPVSPDGHGETVLLVEDEASLRDLTGRILTRHGYRVHAMATGTKAVELARVPGQAIDLLLTDVVMPEMMGNEVAAAVRAIVPGLPALYMSGYAEPILDSHGVPALSIDILEKPFTEAALLTRVRQALEQGLSRPVSGSAELAGDEGDGELQFRPVTG
jgi:hypothetical protein